MNTSRIYSLLKYDWAINKHKVCLTMTLITIVYFCLMLLSFFAKGNLDLSLSEGSPMIIAAFVNSYFKYALIAAVIVVTTILHHKFTNPRSATGYLSLPGTSAEKYTVMLADYATAAIALFFIYLVCYAITMLLGWFVAPGLDWMVNPLMFDSPNNVNDVLLAFNGNHSSQEVNEAFEQIKNNGGVSVDALTSFIDVVRQIQWFAPIFALCEFFAYICINMLFRTNGQLKTIAVFFAAGFVFMMFFMGTLVIGIKNSMDIFGDVTPDVAFETITSIFSFVRYFVWVSPVVLVGLAYLFYHQICKKQAK